MANISKHRDAPGIWQHALLGVIIGAVLMVDLSLPMGVAAGVPYIVPVLISLSFPGRRVTLTVTTLCTILIIVGFYASRPAGIHWMALANRGLAIGAIWISAFLLIERKRVGEALRETGDRLQAVFDTAPDGIIVVDDHGRIESFNRGAEKLFGYVASDVLGKNVSILMPSPHAEAHDGYIARYLSTGEKRIIDKGREVIAKKKNGTCFPVRLAVGELKVGGRRSFTGILHDLTELRHVEKDSLEDTITGLPNRRAFDKLLSASLSRDTTSLLFIDVDRLKAINDELGHVRGDEALTKTAERIRSSLRSTDPGSSARIGGDEFAVVLPNTDRHVAMRIAERVFEQTQPALAEIHPQSGVSIGVATAPKGTAPTELLRMADEALYRAKAHRGRVSR